MLSVVSKMAGVVIGKPKNLNVTSSNISHQTTSLNLQ